MKGKSGEEEIEKSGGGGNKEEAKVGTKAEDSETTRGGE